MRNFGKKRQIGFEIIGGDPFKVDDMGNPIEENAPRLPEQRAGVGGISLRDLADIEPVTSDSGRSPWARPAVLHENNLQTADRLAADADYPESMGAHFGQEQAIRRIPQIPLDGMRPNLGIVNKPPGDR